ncbi:MAG: hypothetical protein ACM3N4_11060 [Nitrososphaerota archaeon]
MAIFPLPVEVQSLLPALGIAPASVTLVERMAGGLSDGRLYRLWLRNPEGTGCERTRVLKYSEPLAGWLGEISGDTHIREAQLAASGLLADLPRDIVTPTRSVAFHGQQSHPTGAALLMRDIQHFLLRRPYRTPPGSLPPDAVVLIKRLAGMHARFWNDPRLDDEALGLMSLERALLVTGPLGVASRLAAGDTLPYLAIADQSWRDFFALAGEPAATRLRAIMAEPERITRIVNRLPRTLVHGDVWGPNMGWIPEASGRQRLLLFDWALALAGPATYDILWQCGAWLTANPVRVLALYRFHLARALHARGLRLDDATWLALADAGYLRTVLTCGEGMARLALSAPVGAAQHSALAWLRWWIERALRAAHRLELLG